MFDPPMEHDQVPDFILNDPDWLAHLALAEAKLAELEPFLKAQYSRILGLCRNKMGNHEAADIAQEAINEFLDQIQIALYVEMDVSRIKESAAYKYQSPEAWLTRAALNRVKDFLKKQSRRRKTFRYVHELRLPRIERVNQCVGRDVIDGPYGSVHCAPLHNLERRLLRLEQQASDRAFVKHYRAALPRLSVPRLRAWVLCNDEFLQPDEAAKLLKLKSAGAAKAAWPEGMPVKEAARLLRCAEGTVSSNVSRARKDLRKELSDLDPLKASRAPAREWPHEFLVSQFGRRGSLEQIVFAIGPLSGPLPVTVSAGPVVWARPASDLILDYARKAQTTADSYRQGIRFAACPGDRGQQSRTACEFPLPERFEENRISVWVVHEGVPELRGQETESHQQRKKDDHLRVRLRRLQSVRPE